MKDRRGRTISDVICVSGLVVSNSSSGVPALVEQATAERNSRQTVAGSCALFPGWFCALLPARVVNRGFGGQGPTRASTCPYARRLPSACRRSKRGKDSDSGATNALPGNSVGPRHAEHMLGQIAEDQIRRDRRDLAEERFPEFRFHVVFFREAESAAGLYAVLSRRPLASADSSLASSPGCAPESNRRASSCSRIPASQVASTYNRPDPLKEKEKACIMQDATVSCTWIGNSRSARGVRTLAPLCFVSPEHLKLPPACAVRHRRPDCFDSVDMSRAPWVWRIGRQVEDQSSSPTSWRTPAS